MLSPTMIAVFINVLAQVLPWLGVNIGLGELTTTVQVIVAIGTGVWLWVERTTLRKVGKAESDVNLAGVLK